MQVTFLQTADSIVYREMLEVSSKTFVAYCARHGFDYQYYLGIVRGTKPWHAALNRVPLLQAFATRGYTGWVIYADADVYVADLEFDVAAYLEGKQAFFMAAAPSGWPGAPWWEINNGVFALNFSHPLTSLVLDRWGAGIKAAAPDELLREEAAWGAVVDDQHLLHLTFQNMPEVEAGLFLDDGGVLNWKSKFLPQLVRDQTHTFASRVATLQERTAAVLGEDWTPPDLSSEEQGKACVRAEFVNALYGVLFGRPADAGGRAHVMDMLNTGRRSIEEELLAALGSEEARRHLAQMFAAQPAEAVAAPAERLVSS